MRFIPDGTGSFRSGGSGGWYPRVMVKSLPREKPMVM